MKTRILAAGAAVAALTLGFQANAAVVGFGFNNGGGVAGHGFLTIAPNVAPADPDPACGTAGHNPCRTDPPGAFMITGISGLFTDAADGIFDAAITGIVPTSPTNERDPVFDPLVPSSLLYLAFPGGPPSSNNLYFPDGSPIDCAFPYAGTFVDVFGMAFTVAGGYTVNLWGDGDLFGPGTKTYGVGVTDGEKELFYQFAGVNGTSPTPEPAVWTLMLGGFGLAGASLRRRRKSPAAA